MTTTIYDELKSISSEILAEFKQGTVNLVKLTTGTGPADNPGAAVEVNHSLNAVVKGVSFKYVAQGFAVSSDLEVTCAVVSGITPDEKDFVEIDSTRFKIIRFIPTPAAGTQVTWKFLVRKGG